MSQSLNKIDPRYVDGSRGAVSKVLRLNSDLTADFRDSVSITEPLETLQNFENIELNYSNEFQTLILKHNNVNLKIASIDSENETKGTFQVRVFNDSGNGSDSATFNLIEPDEGIFWVGQKPTLTLSIPRYRCYIFSFTYYGNYQTQYPNLKSWVGIFTTEETQNG